jgi:hypothetical protein
MKRLSFIFVLLVCLMTSGAFATQTVWDFNVPAGLWSTAANWAVLPTYPALPADTGLTTDYVKVQGTKVCNLDSAAGNFPYTKLTVAGTTSGGGATLNITDGSIGTGNEFQVSDAGKTGIVVQTGGAVTTFQGSTAGKLEIGYKLNGVGSWSISGGSIGFSGSTNVGQIMVGGSGANGSVGTFTIHGSAATINTDKFWVGTKDATGAAGYPGTGTVKFELTDGVSPIKVQTSVTLDNAAAASIANLVVALLDEDVPAGPIVLIKNSSNINAVSGTFDTVSGDQSPWDRALEGDVVWLYTPLGVLHTYTLTYQYNADAGTIANDIALTPEPATLALLGLGSLIAIRRNRK